MSLEEKILKVKLLLFIAVIMVLTKDGRYYTLTKLKLLHQVLQSSQDSESMFHSSLYQDFQ